MKLKFGALFLCVLQVPMTMVGKTVLPDSCGDPKVTFDVITAKKPPVPVTPADGKAKIVFIESINNSFGCGMATFGCNPTARVGIDGAWVGATQGNSYFSVDVAPGEHHVCTGWQSSLGHLSKMVGLDSVNAEAGKVYYFEIKVSVKVHNYGGAQETDRNLDFTQVNEDEANYRIKISELATSTQKK
jgi:hypothetical protein